MKNYRMSGECSASKFLPDNQRVVTGDLGGFLYLWDIATGEILREYEDVKELPVACIDQR
jgi:WD40 repeat protein